MVWIGLDLDLNGFLAFVEGTWETSLHRLPFHATELCFDSILHLPSFLSDPGASTSQASAFRFAMLLGPRLSYLSDSLRSSATFAVGSRPFRVSRWFTSKGGLKHLCTYPLAGGLFGLVVWWLEVVSHSTSTRRKKHGFKSSNHLSESN